MFHSVSWLLAILIAISGCRSTSDVGDLMSGETRGQRVGLDQFDYEVDASTLQVVAARIGCEQAARYMALPRSGSMRQLIAGLNQAEFPYNFLSQELFSDDIVRSQCRSAGQHLDELSGVKSLHASLASQQQGLTIIAVGGFGSHLTETGAFYDSRQRWLHHFGDGDPSFRVVRQECMPNSYAVDDVCVPLLIERFEELERSATMPHRYLLIGYSKGGTTAIQALSASQELRDQTLSVLTFGAPIAGGLAAEFVEPILDRIAEGQEQLAELELGVAGTVLNFGAGFAAREQQSISFAGLLTPAQLTVVRQGFNSLHPENRATFLRQQVAGWDFSKSAPDPLTGETSMPIFHVAAVSDIGSFHALPRWTFDGQRSVPDVSTVNFNQLSELVFLPSFRDHPLNDTCVALEHSVIPRQWLPRQASTRLLALMKLDHMSLAMGESSPLDPPGVAILDGLIAAAMQQILRQGGQL